MPKTIKLSANFDTRTIDLAALGYTARDSVTVNIKGFYQDEGAGPDSYRQVHIQHDGDEWDISDGGKWDINMKYGLSLTLLNQDPTLGGNLDPNKDFSFYITPALFTDGDNSVNFHKLTKMQTEAVANGEKLYFAYDGNDTVYLPNKNEMKSFNSNKFFYGDDGSDKIYGGNRNDKIDGGGYNDTIYGGGGNDTIWGGSSVDTLNGGSGKDVLYGGASFDYLTGGKQADTFLYKSYFDSLPGTVASDHIMDFSHKDGDKINLAAVFADFTHNPNAHFTWIGKSDFSHTAGELHYVKMGDQTYVEADLTGGGSAGFTIIFEDVIKFVGSDFVL